ncbi:MAG: hypothetical protein ACLTJ5_13270 [Clostridium sp.]
MKWNQKGIIACVVLFFVIIGALMVQGVQKTNNQEDAHYASEEDVVSVEKKGDGETGINKIGRTNKDSQAENGSKYKYTKREN